MSLIATAVGFVVLLSVVADRVFSADLTNEHGVMAVRVILHSVLMLCLPIGAFLSIDAVKPNGVWTRLSFYPVARVVLVSIVMTEIVAIAIVAATGLLSPVAIAATRHGYIQFYSLVVSGAALVLFNTAIVSWSLFLGRTIVRFANEKYAKYALEAIALLVIVTNGFVLAGAGNTIHGFYGVMDRVSPDLPTTPVESIMEASISGLPIPLWACAMVLTQTVVPLLLLGLLPTRPETSSGPTARQARGPRKALRRYHEQPVFRARPLAGVMALCFHRQLLREPGYLRYVILASGALFVVIYVVAQGKLMVQGVGSVLTACAMCLFVAAMLVSSLSLPIERANMVRLRMASVRPIKVLTAKMVSAAPYPTLLWLIGVVLVLGAFRLGAAALAVFLVIGAAAIVAGLALGLFMGTVLSKNTWTEVVGVYDPFRRLFMAIPLVAGLLVGNRFVDRLLGDLHSGFVVAFVDRKSNAPAPVAGAVAR